MAWKAKELIIQPKGVAKIFMRETQSLTICDCSCQQIILSDQPGPSECHGCPYRHFSHDNLQTALLSAYPDTLTATDLPEIMQTVKAGHPHVACTRVFEITHGGFGVKKGEGVGGGESVTHPNQYAARSRELEKAKKDIDSGQTEDSVAMEVT
jgi:DNA primase large subunit